MEISWSACVLCSIFPLRTLWASWMSQVKWISLLRALICLNSALIVTCFSYILGIEMIFIAHWDLLFTVVLSMWSLSL